VLRFAMEGSRKGGKEKPPIRFRESGVETMSGCLLAHALTGPRAIRARELIIVAVLLPHHGD